MKLPQNLQYCLPIAAAIICGIFIAIIPDLVISASASGGVFLADNDQLLYMTYMSKAYFNHPLTIADSVPLEYRATSYPWLQLAPSVIVCRSLGLSPLFCPTVSRVIAGIGMSLSTFSLAMVLVQNRWQAFLVTTWILFATGVVSGFVGASQVSYLLRVFDGVDGSLLSGPPRLLQQWRILNPSLSLPFLLAFIASWIVYLDAPSRRRFLLASLFFGVLFYVYFYYWTATFVALMLVSFVERFELRKSFGILALGTLIGLPAVVEGYVFKESYNSDWLERSDKFIQIGRFSELLIPLYAIFVVVCGLILCFTISRRLLPLCAVAIAGLLMANHQVITGWQIENYHWCFVWGPATALMTCALLVMGFNKLHYDRYRGFRRVIVSLVAPLLALWMISGAWLRAIETQYSSDSVQLARELVAYQDAGWSVGGADAGPRCVIAGPREFVQFAVVLENLSPLDHYAVTMSSSVSNLEWDDRIALNEVLQGKTREEFRLEQSDKLSGSHWGPWSRDADALQRRIDSRVDAYDRVVQDVEDYVARFRVRYCVVGIGLRDRFPIVGWKLHAEAASWVVFENPGL